MKTYQDFLALTDSEVTDFIFTTISEYVGSSEYKQALIAESYDAHRNKTIVDYQKLIYTITGKAVPDTYSANYKLASNFFHRFVTQENQYLLGNGVMWSENATAEKLGDEFDANLQKAGHWALVDSVSYGFFDYDQLRVFKMTEFAPLYDEENGALMAGIRFWQVSKNKPLRATFYEIDGYTEYIEKDGERRILAPKRAYKITVTGDEVDRQNGTEIYDGENYPTFPIVPLWANENHQSELVGMREQIDCYDLIKSGFADTVDEASYIYWALQDEGGMDDVDLTKFVERMKTIHAAVVQGDSARVEAHSIDAPTESREALLDRLATDMYKDFMAFDTDKVADGAVTATQIKSAYEPLSNKVDGYEYQVKEFLKDILKVAGVDDEPTFTRSKIVNVQEEMNTLLAAAQYLPQEYVTKKILTLMGDGDKAEDILEQMENEDVNRYGEVGEGPEETVPEGVQGNGGQAAQEQ